MARDGKVVIRPDSGDPVEIICGTEIKTYSDTLVMAEVLGWVKESVLDEIANETPHGECGDDSREVLFNHRGKSYKSNVTIDWNRHDKQFYYMDGSKISQPTEVELTPAQKGVIQLLNEIFGSTQNSVGYYELDSHIGAIYGDAITMDRAKEICKRLAYKGFASTNIVFGIGSYTYQYQTRDTFGFALKSTHAIIDGVEHNIFKDPITDDGTKKSQTGRVIVVETTEGDITVLDGYNKQDAETKTDFNLLKTIFNNGSVFQIQTLQQVRNKIRGIK